MRSTFAVAAALLTMAVATGASGPPAAPEINTDLGNAWRSWAYSRPIEVGSDAVEQRLIRVPLPEAIFAHAAAGLHDLRVISDTGEETGYVLHAKSPGGTNIGETWFRTKLLDTGTVPGSYSQAVVDIGNDGGTHDLVVIELADRSGEFFAWAEIASSSDYANWRVVRSRAPVYHFRETRDSQALHVTYPPTRDRWLRVRLERGDETAPIAGLRVGERHGAVKVELETAGLELKLRKDSPTDQSWWESHSERDSAPIAGVRIETPNDEFHRPIKISASDNGNTWREVGRGQIYRFLPREDDIGAVRESVQVEFRQDSAKSWRVAVIDGNDAPIEDSQIALLRAVQSVVFRPAPGHAYRLLYGNSRAAWPKYELAQLIDSDQRDSAPLGAVGAEQENPDFVSAEPFSERHPVLLWAALGLAVLVLGALAIRSLR